jgi:hypothetical protein
VYTQSQIRNAHGKKSVTAIRLCQKVHSAKVTATLIQSPCYSALQFMNYNFYIEDASWSSLVQSNVAIIWDIAPCSLYVNCCFGGTYHLHLQGRKSAKPESAFLIGRFSTLKIQVKCSSITSVHILTTWHHTPQDSNMYSSHCC